MLIATSSVLNVDSAMDSSAKIQGQDSMTHMGQTNYVSPIRQQFQGQIFTPLKSYFAVLVDVAKFVWMQFCSTAAFKAVLREARP